MASDPTPRLRRSSALMVGLGATLIAPAAAQADPDPEPTAPTGPSLSKLDPGDQAIARRAQADRPTPAATKPTPPANPGTPPGDRTGDPTDYTPARTKPAPVKAKPKAAKPKASKPDKPANPGTPPGDRTGNKRNYEPVRSKPTNPGTPPGDRTAKKRNYEPPKASPTNPGAPAGDRTGDPADYTPPATPTSAPTNPGTPPGDRTGKKRDYEPPKASPTTPGTPPGDRTARRASYAPPTPGATNPGAPAGDRTGNPADYAPPTPGATRPGAPAGDRTGDPADYAPPKSAPTRPGAPAGDRTGNPADYTPTNAPPPGDRTGNPADYPTTPVTYDPRVLIGGSNDVIRIGHAPRIAPPAGVLLPFPGGEGQRVSVGTTCGSTRDAGGGDSRKCSGLPPRYEGKHRPGSRAGITRETTITGTEGRTANVMTPGGEKANLQVTAEVLVKLGGEAKLKELDVSYKKIARGNKIVYQITASPSRIDQIANDPSVAPKANDPRTIRPGETVIINEENFTGYEGSGSIKHVKVEHSKAEGDRQSAGVQRVNDSTIVITVGDEKFVRQLTRLGVGTDFAAGGVYSAGDDANGNLRQVTLNIRTKRGWDDYQRFLATGRIAYRPGLKFSTVDRTTHDGANGVFAKLGPVEWSTTGSHTSTDTRTSRNSDGSVSQSETLVTDGVTFSYSQTRRADGTTGPPSMSLLVRNANTRSVRDYASKSGDDASGADGDHDDVKVSFDAKELDELQDLAIKRIQRVRKDMGQADLTRKEIIDGKGDDSSPSVTTDLEIARAKNPAARLYALYRGAKGMDQQVLEYLTDNYYGGKPTCGAPGHVTVLPD